ncbi:transposase [Staphylococcus muscae]|uniref:Transposase n=1 Tax=Staphylococcus muscae TaxID=1294 RepID=A0A240C064_9STAP|nr:RNA-guided endonuclease TnpB family protein [Staphylococcus muscae]AVQ34368.1 transposase [Staphylococcus muscae]AVQ34371.1 transposase [Staphylococcus muscae]AVQ34375.1 transposase [Staphylococcus muscae]PNZ01128.1 transposase [Staphylococcus muscae]SNW00471.1 putative transposase [Staphylococcus muscae]
MYRGIECKIYPNKAQQLKIEQTFGCTRFVWNEMLNMINQRYQNNNELKMLSYPKLSALLPALKLEYPWLKDIDSVAIQCAVKTLSETFDRFFKGYSRYPKFKSKKITRQSYLSTIRGNNIRFNDNQRYIKLPKLGWVKCKSSVQHIENSRIKSVTVTRKSTGYYYISLLVESDNQALPKTGKSVGIDLGLTHLAITSDGKKYASQRLHLKYKKQLHYWEKRVARRRLNAIKNGMPLKDAKNYQKAKRQVARIHEKIVNTRKDYIHKITTDLVERYDLIVLEDLKTSNLMKNHKLSRSIASQSWRIFRTFIEYKCVMYSKTSMTVNPYKSSQYCSSCGFDSGKKTLDVRCWICSECSTEHDRDINASKNILNFGLEQALVK